MKREMFYNYRLDFDKYAHKRVNVTITRVNIRDEAPLKTLYDFLSKKEAAQYAKKYIRENNLFVKRGQWLGKINTIEGVFSEKKGGEA